MRALLLPAQVTLLGRVAAAYYVGHQSMAKYNEFLKKDMTDVELFRLFSQSAEFDNIHVREEEKLELAKLAARVPIPIKEGPDDPRSKINVLLQVRSGHRRGGRHGQKRNGRDARQREEGLVGGGGDIPIQV